MGRQVQRALLEQWELSGPAGLGVTPGSLVAPAYDSGWINITNMTGQNIVLTHNIGNVDVSVDIRAEQP